MNDFYVYAWIRPDTGDVFYIGKGRGRRDTKKKNPNNRMFLNIVDKLRRGGVEPRIERIHSGLTEAEALHLEMVEIAERGRRDKGTGTLANMTDGGEGVSGMVHSAEARSRIGAAAAGHKYALGHKHSEITKSKISESSAGRRHSDEARAKLSAARSGMKLSDSYVLALTLARRLEPSKRKDGSFKGISYSASRKKWQAKITVNGRGISLGRYVTPEDAARAYDSAAIAAWGAGNCYLNFPIAA